MKLKHDDMKKMELANNHHTWREHTRHRMNFDFSEDELANRALNFIFGYYHRSLDSCANLGKVHPPLEIYISCLSDCFAHGAVKRARDLGLLPKYSKKNAEKYGVEAGKSYCYG